MKHGAEPLPEIVEALREGGVSLDEFTEICQAAIENLSASTATSLAADINAQQDGNGTTDYVEAIKRMAAQDAGHQG